MQINAAAAKAEISIVDTDRVVNKEMMTNEVKC